MTATIAELERQSVQALPDAEKGASLMLPWFTTSRGALLPAIGTRQREYELRRFFKHDYNYMGQSAIGGLINKIVATPWEIKGKRRTEYFADVLRNADFYRGWNVFLGKFLLDFLTLDGGAYAEIIAPGNVLKPPTGPITGLAALDALNCVPTGDPEFPVIYTNIKGEMRRLHYTRVMHMVDMPISDQKNPGYGLCALSRAISVVAREIYMGRYIETKLDDKPAAGYTVFNNIVKSEYDALVAQYQQQQSNDGIPVWGRHMNIFSKDPSKPIDVKHVTNSSAPEEWSFVDYTQLDVNAWALALGVDVQEIWQLSGGNLGSSQQSVILHAKSLGRMLGVIYTSLERLINLMLPDSNEMAFKQRDPYESEERAKTANSWASFVNSVSSTMSKDEQRRLLANMVEAYADTVTDESGEIVRYDDLDTDDETAVVTPAPQAEEVQADTAPAEVAPDEEETATDGRNAEAATPVEQQASTPTEAPVSSTSPAPVSQQPPTTTNESTPQEVPQSFDKIVEAMNAGLITIGQAQEALGLPVDPALSNMYMRDGVPVPKEVLLQLYETQFGRGVDTFSNALAAAPSSETTPEASKEIQATRLDFEGDWSDLISAAREDDMTRRRFGTVARALISKYGRRAYEDGLRDGGVEDAELDDSDRAEILALTAEQSAYVTGIGATLFQGDGISDAQADNKATQWFNGSIMPFYQKGLASADKNGNYEFTGDDGEESCDDCTRLKGQVHRLKDWLTREYNPPGGSKLACAPGKQCKHLLVRTTARSKGNY